MRQTGNKRAVESILVAKDNAALPAGGTAIVNNTTGNVNLADGQLAVIDASGRGTNALGVALTAGDTLANSPVVRILQGTDTSSNVQASLQFPFAKRPFETSGDIIGQGVVAWTGKAYADPNTSITVVGEATGGAGEINIEDLSEYWINVAYRGRRTQEYDTSTHGVASRRFSFTSPAYSTAGFASSLDHLVQNLGYVVNRDSRAFNFVQPSFGANQPVFALAIDSAGAGGTAITAVAGTVVPVVLTNSGLTKSITLTDDLVASLAAVVASGDVPNTATIELIDLSTAGAGTCDQLLLVAMDEVTAFEDRIPYVKIRLDVGLGGAFDSTVLNSEDSKAFEGQGTYRQWKIFYDNTAGQRKYSQYRGFDTLKITYPDSLDSTEVYAAYIIEHFEAHQLNLAGISNSPQKTIILVPDGDTVTKASLEAVLNPYFASCPAALPAVAL